MIDLLPWVRSIRPLLIVADPLAVVAAGLVLDPAAGPTAVLSAALAALVVCRGADLHRSRLVLSVIEDVPKLALAAVIASLTMAALTPARDVAMWRWATLLGLAAATFLAMVVTRATAYALAHVLRRSGRSSHPVLIVGAGAIGQRLARAFLGHPEYGLRPVGIVDTAPDLTSRDLPVPLIGGIDALEGAMIDLGVDDVVFAFPETPDDHTIAVVRRCLEADRQVFVVPRFFEMMGLDHHRRTEVIGDVALMRLRRWGLRPHTLRLKRLLDVVLSLVALVPLAPVLLACAIAVRLETGPGVIFKQVRIGRGGRPFTLYKFRSLAPSSQQEGATTWSIDHDARVGPVGRFLRRTSLDELPQLVNVLKGDMSLVGPRPERPFFVREFTRSELRYDDRHRVRTGLTGWAQVNDLRGDTPIDARVRYDNYYIENWSLWTDIKIMARTVRAVLRHQPAPGRASWLASAAPPPAPQPQSPARPLALPQTPHVLHVSMPTTEGVARVLMGYVTDQMARGWEVTVACPETGWLAEEARRAGARVVRWDARRSPGPSLLRETRSLRRVVHHTRPDVVHLHSAKAGLAGRLALRGTLPTLYQPHAWSFEATRGPMRTAAIRAERFAQRWTTELVCVSRAELAVGERHGIRTTTTLAVNGVDAAAFAGDGTTPAQERTAARQRLGLADVPTVLCVGRLTEQKGQLDLLDAWELVSLDVPSAQLVLVGDGPDRPVLEERAGGDPRLLFAGTRSDVETWLAAADVVVAPSRWEGMAVAPLEAMAAGRSVVATAVTGMADSVPPGAGALVAPGDPVALATRLVERLLDPVRSDAEGAVGRAHVRVHHDVHASARHVARLTLRQARRHHGTADALQALEPMPLTTPASRPVAAAASPAPSPVAPPVASPVAPQEPAPAPVPTPLASSLPRPRREAGRDEHDHLPVRIPRPRTSS